MQMGPAFGHGAHFDALEAREARQYFTEGKVQSIVLQRQAIRAVEDEIADQEQDDGAAPPVAAAAAPELDLSKIFVVHGHDRASKAEVAGFVRKLGFEPIILHERPNKGARSSQSFARKRRAQGLP
jgi:predicted nucleotide-binding protein